jgi:hypothetical protein
MIIVSVHPFHAASSDYGPATQTLAAPDLGVAMKLFGSSGNEGMAWQYVVADKESGEPLVTYYADCDDLAASLNPA